MALETRGVGSARRTPLEIIRLRGLDWLLLLLALAATLSALAWRMLA
jgi:hypothetical protein